MIMTQAQTRQIQIDLHEQSLITGLAANYTAVRDVLERHHPIETNAGRCVYVPVDQWLSLQLSWLNVRNRIINPQRVEAIQLEVLEHGADASVGWDFITILQSGELVDGQHRMCALYWLWAKKQPAPQPINVWVRYDAPEHVVRSIDAGRHRSPRDIQVMRSKAQGMRTQFRAPKR